MRGEASKVRFWTWTNRLW